MNVRFQRDVKHSYMILSEDAPMDCDADSVSFTAEMLRNNRIEGLLPMTVERVDQAVFYRYEITSSVNLLSWCSTMPVDLDSMHRVLWSILDTAGSLEEFLLDPSCLFLNPEALFLTQDHTAVLLALVPSLKKDLKESLVGLVRFLLTKINREDKEAIVFGYQVIHELEEENTTPSDLKKYLIGGDASSDGGNMDPEQGESETENFADVMSGSPDRGKEAEQVRHAGVARDIRASIWIVLLCLPAVGLLYFVLHISALGYYTNMEIGACLLLAGLMICAAVCLRKHMRMKTLQKEEQVEKTSASMDWEDVMVPSPEDDDEPVFLSVDHTVSLRDIRLGSRCAILTPAEGGASLPVIRVCDEEIHIGNAEKKMPAFVTLPDPTVSRIHARLIPRDGIFYICDLNSTNGTRVNGQLLDAFTPVPLPEGARVDFAGVEYRVRMQ